MTSTRWLLASVGVGWLAFVLAAVLSPGWAYPLIALQAFAVAGQWVQTCRGK